MTLLKMKRNLESNIKSSYIASGGMRILSCIVSIDKSVGMIKVDIAINPSTLPDEAVDELIHKTFTTIGLTAFAEWQDVSINHSSSTIVRIHAEGIMTTKK